MCCLPVNQIAIPEGQQGTGSRDYQKCPLCGVTMAASFLWNGIEVCNMCIRWNPVCQPHPAIQSLESHQEPKAGAQGGK
jgi:hypothetical protein